MFTMVTENTRKAVSAAAAVAIVSFGGLVMDQAYLAAAPRGTIEIGELTALDNTEIATNADLAAVQLPEIVVVAKRVASMVAQDDRGTQLPSPAISAGF